MALSAPLEKVTAFITRGVGVETELLLLSHPFAGNQLPAGTVEPGEAAEAAVLREVSEETGLSNVTLVELIVTREDVFPGKLLTQHQPTPVFARPDPDSFQWASFPRAVMVEELGRRSAGYVQVSFREYDRFPESDYVTMEITGWVSDALMTSRIRRHLYHLTYDLPTESRWQVAVDNHHFTLFWARLYDAPALAPPHDSWLAVFAEYWQSRQMSD